ncbi:hypothetical protein CXF68_15110 [Tenacibaculum sp. Bg11-29]|uniref:hypothetical protein n=1 Tax=Tenacibaculum sp. Bg11-29 TaxID=2058306 RepID=UPI000C32FDE3|nr:hypothetical protein [Tenacibaculum sp. Bg11-29]PKH51937.1 hypothetical protein CXF68_15110 [Tenacibaculum sp. Bg11-29]
MIKKIFYVFLGFIVFLLLIKYFDYSLTYKKIYKESIEIKKNVFDFFYYTAEEDLTKKTHLERLNSYFKENMKEEVFGNGYRVVKSKDNTKYIFYTFGKDKKDNHLKYLPYNSIDESGSYIFNKQSFFDYLIGSFKQYDLVLFEYKNTNNNFLYNGSYFRRKKLFLNLDGKKIKKPFENKILNCVKDVESNYINKDRKKIVFHELGLDKEYRQIFFKIDNQKIENLNFRNLSKEKIKKLELNLTKSIFKLKGIENVSYGYFSMLVDPNKFP